MTELSALVQARIEAAGLGPISDEAAERIGRVCIAAAVDLETAIAALRAYTQSADIEAIAAELQAFATRTPTSDP